MHRSKKVSKKSIYTAHRGETSNALMRWLLFTRLYSRLNHILLVEITIPRQIINSRSPN